MIRRPPRSAPFPSPPLFQSRGRAPSTLPPARVLPPEIHDWLPVHPAAHRPNRRDRKSTRLNSSHANISYAVFCLKKKTSPSSPPSPLHSTPSLRSRPLLASP